MPQLIEARSIDKVFTVGQARTVVLNGLNFELKQGQSVALMGPSGCGKTTLLNLLGLLDQPSAGRLVLAGCEVSRLDADARARNRNALIGFVFQSANLLPRLTVAQNLALPLQYRKWSEPDISQCVETALAQFGLQELIGRLPCTLSGGQQQRIAILRAMIAKPKLLLADEPTGALDQGTGRQIMQCLLDQQKRTHAGLVVVTHDPSVAAQCNLTYQFEMGQLSEVVNA